MAQKQNRSRYAILGILSYGPMSGYDIQKFFADIAGFWQESYGQIYPNLNQLLQEGLVNKQIEQRDKGPNRHQYTLTHAEPYQTWFKKWPNRFPHRNELLKLIFSHQAGHAATQQQLLAYKNHLDGGSGNLNIIEAWQEAQLDEGDPHALYRRMAVRYGLHTHRALLTWCDECLAELELVATQVRPET